MIVTSDRELLEAVIQACGRSIPPLPKLPARPSSPRWGQPGRRRRRKMRLYARDAELSRVADAICATVKSARERLRAKPARAAETTHVDVRQMLEEIERQSLRKFLKGEVLADLLPSWLTAQLGLPVEIGQRIEASSTLVEHWIRGAPLMIVAGGRRWPAAELLAILDQHEKDLPN